MEASHATGEPMQIIKEIEQNVFLGSQEDGINQLTGEVYAKIQEILQDEEKFFPMETRGLCSRGDKFHVFTISTNRFMKDTIRYEFQKVLQKGRKLISSEYIRELFRFHNCVRVTPYILIKVDDGMLKKDDVLQGKVTKPVTFRWVYQEVDPWFILAASVAPNEYDVPHFHFSHYQAKVLFNYERFEENLLDVVVYTAEFARQKYALDLTHTSRSTYTFFKNASFLQHYISMANDYTMAKRAWNFICHHYVWWKSDRAWEEEEEVQ